MATLNIDLSGRGGLAPRYFGDLGQLTSAPQRRNIAPPGALVAGKFNPWTRYGYLSGSVDTVLDTTFDNATAAQLASDIYDAINDDYYLAERGSQVFRGDGLDDTSHTRVINLGSTGTPVIHDMEIYQINGVRTVFTVFERNGALNMGTSALPITTINDVALNREQLTYDAVASNFSANQVITGQTSGVTAWLENSITTPSTVVVKDATGTFLDNETVIGATNGSLTVDGNSISVGTIAGSFSASIQTNYAFVRVADNGFAYLFSDYSVHKIDGTTNGGSNGTISPNVLLFPPFFRINDAIDYRGLMFIVVQQTTFDATTAQSNSSNFETPSGVYVWDRFSSVIQTRDFVPVKDVKAIKHIYVAPNGSLRIMCVGNNRLGQIREYNGSTFEIIEELGLNSLPKYRDGLTFSSGLNVWLGEDGNMYAHGNCNIPGQREILSIIGSLPTFSTNSTGAVLYGSTSANQGFTICYHDQSNYVAKKWYPFSKGTVNTLAQQNNQGDAYSAVVNFPSLAKINYVRVYHLPGTTSGSTVQGTFKTYVNNSTTASSSVSITRDDIVQGWKYIPITQGAKNAVYAIQFEVEWADDTTTSDNYDWHPFMVEVDYDFIQKKK